jgi:hypothetical protein
MRERAHYRWHQITLAEEIYNTHAQVSSLLYKGAGKF